MSFLSVPMQRKKPSAVVGQVVMQVFNELGPANSTTFIDQAGKYNCVNLDGDDPVRWVASTIPNWPTFAAMVYENSAPGAYMQFTPSGAVDFEFQGDWTIEFGWTAAIIFGPAGNPSNLLSKRGAAPLGPFLLEYDGATTLKLQLSSDGTNADLGTFSWATNVPVAPIAFGFLAITKQGNLLRIYNNGTLVQSPTLPGELWAGSIDNIQSGPARVNLFNSQYLLGLRITDFCRYTDATAPMALAPWPLP